MGKTDVHLHLGLTSHTHTMGAPDKKVYSSGTTPQPVTMKMSSVEEMLPHLEKLGISKGVLLSGGEKKGFLCNDEVCEAAEKYKGRFTWLCNLDEEHEEPVEKRLADYKSRGAAGIGEFAANHWIGTEFIEKVFTAAEKLEMPVLFHMSPEAGFNYGIADEPGLPLLEKALIAHPKLIFVGHSQPFWHEMSKDAKPDNASRNSWGSGPVIPGGRLWYLFEKYENLYGDLSANSGGNALMRDVENGLAFLNKFQDRLMFGTDMTNTKMEFPLGKWLDEQLESKALSQTVYNKICFENAGRIFGV